MTHELEDDDGVVVIGWEHLPDVTEYPTAPVDDVEVGSLPAPPILEDDDR